MGVGFVAAPALLVGVIGLVRCGSAAKPYTVSATAGCGVYRLLASVRGRFEQLLCASGMLRQHTHQDPARLSRHVRRAHPRPAHAQSDPLLLDDLATGDDALARHGTRQHCEETGSPLAQAAAEQSVLTQGIALREREVQSAPDM
jgi:hypothetical protein